MKHKLPTVTIGIPTYLPGESLVRTIESIYAQQKFNKIDRILVDVDGGKMDEAVYRKIKNPKLLVTNYRRREGQSARINKILKRNRSPLLILTNDDALWKRDCLQKLLLRYELSEADLTSGHVTPLASSGSLERILYVNNLIRDTIASRWNRGNNYLTCNGRLIMLSRRFTEKLTVPKGLINSDAFIYLKCTTASYLYCYHRDAVIYYRNPSNIKEHLSQSHRFQKSLLENENYFAFNLKKYYTIPALIKLRALLSMFRLNPIETTGCLLLFAASKIYQDQSTSNGLWKTDLSTKKLTL